MAGAGDHPCTLTIIGGLADRSERTIHPSILCHAQVGELEAAIRKAWETLRGFAEIKKLCEVTQVRIAEHATNARAKIANAEGMIPSLKILGANSEPIMSSTMEQARIQYYAAMTQLQLKKKGLMETVIRMARKAAVDINYVEKGNPYERNRDNAQLWMPIIANQNRQTTAGSGNNDDLVWL